jgi:predicted Zn-dependent protease
MAHVSLKHGEAILREGGSWKAGIGALARVAAAAAGARDTSFTSGTSKLFGDAVGDLSQKLVRDGYGRQFEIDADREGTLVLYGAGYDASGLRDYLEASGGRARGTWETHPSADDRLTALEPLVATYGGPFDGGVGSTTRAARFQRTVGTGGAPLVGSLSPGPAR